MKLLYSAVVCSCVIFALATLVDTRPCQDHERVVRTKSKKAKCEPCVCEGGGFHFNQTVSKTHYTVHIGRGALKVYSACILCNGQGKFSDVFVDLYDS